ncbi:MAG TPA: PaaX family transcriptional regulator C-terminal domain-containing protein [Nocardioidaceae bacterium]|jgi:phenylacetic acid degradation operon negative regulatory protein|nr:PaaX family transcriptional regulator C-terminal domain-containing protein [Nocardioidaceae bacterium]
MHARSALFDVYGDHLRARGGRAPVAALVRMVRPLGVTAPAVRTAISRMVRQGWLEPVRLEEGPGYALTARATARLDEAATRIYRTRASTWDGAWDLLVLAPAGSRSVRDRVRSQLAFLGYGQLSDSTWIGPTRSPEVEELLAGEQLEASRFEARDDDPAQRARRAWDLQTLAAAYDSWHTRARGLVEDPAVILGRGALEAMGPDERAFAVRSLLVHEWRLFLFTDPGLPAELLPERWPGHAAARFFAEQARRLAPAASRFVDACLAGDERATPDRTELAVPDPGKR